MFLYILCYLRRHHCRHIGADSQGLPNLRGTDIVQGRREPRYPLRQFGARFAATRIYYYSVAGKNIFPLVPFVEFFPIIGTYEQNKLARRICIAQGGKGVYRV